MYWNIKSTLAVYLLAVNQLQGLYGGSDVTTVPVPPSPTPVSIATDTAHAVSLSPRPVAKVEKGYPLVLTINIVTNTSWRLEWSTSNTGEDPLGSVASGEIEVCPPNMTTEACLVNTTLVRFPVDQPRHGDIIYCAVLFGAWSTSPTTHTTSTTIYILVPVESVLLKSSSGDISGDQLIVKEGDNVTLYCETSPSRPRAAISWIPDIRDTSSLGDVSITSVDTDLFRTSQNLTILAERAPNSSRSSIRCNAVSGGSNVTSNVLEVIVLGLPTQPTAMTVYYINKANVKLKWSIDSDSVYRVNFTILILPATAGLTVGPHTQHNAAGPNTRQNPTEPHTRHNGVDGTTTGHGPASVPFSSRISGLQANLAYNVSVMSYNVVGSSAPTSIYTVLVSDETEADSGMLYFRVGLALIVVACLMLVLLGIILVIGLKRGHVLQSGMLCGLPVMCRSREKKEPDPVYEDLDSLSKADAPVIEKRLRNARKAKSGAKKSAGLPSGIYNSIAPNLVDVIQKENTGNIYDDIPGASALFSSSGSGADDKVTLAVTKSEIEDLSNRKWKPTILKKPPSRKQHSPVCTPDDDSPDPAQGTTLTITINDTPELECRANRNEDKSTGEDDVPCEYMDMKVPESTTESEYMEVRLTDRTTDTTTQ